MLVSRARGQIRPAELCRQRPQEILERRERTGGTEDVVGDLVLHVVLHLVEHRERFGLVLDQRVLLAVGAQADAVAELVHVVQVLLPEPVQRIENDEPLDGLQRVGILVGRLRFVGALDLVENDVAHFLRRSCRRRVPSASRSETPGSPTAASASSSHSSAGLSSRAILDDPRLDDLLDDVEDRLARVFAVDDVVAEAVQHLALLVHHVVILQRAFADGEIVLFHAALGGFDGAVEPAMHERLALLHPQLLHDVADPSAAEQPHQIVFQRHIKPAAARDRPGARNVRAAGGRCAALRGVRCRSRAVRRRRARPAPSLMSVPRPAMLVAMVTEPRWPARATISASRWWYFALRTLCGNLLAAQHAREHFAGFDADRADQQRLALAMPLDDLVDDGVVLLPARLVDDVVLVLAHARLVGGNDDDAELVDVLELGRFGFGGAGHARQFLVETEIILDGDRRQRLRLALDGHAFLRLDRLVQTVAPAAARHEAAGEFVDDHHLVFLDDVFDVLLEEAVGAQQLRNVVDLLAPLVEGLLDALLLLFPLAIRQLLRIHLLQRRHQVGNDERIGIVRVEEFAALLGQVGVVLLLVDREEQLLLQVEHVFLGRIFQHFEFRLVHQLPDLGLFHHLLQLLVLRRPELDLVQQAAGLVLGGRDRRWFSRPRCGHRATASRRSPADCRASSARGPVRRPAACICRRRGVDTVDGPLMMSGVRASSMRIESTSSTMA